MTGKLTRIQKEFIGTERVLYNGTVQKVVGLYGKRETGEALFRISCNSCDKYSDIFPEGVVMTKGNFTNGTISCLCSSKSFNPKGQEQKSAYYKMLVDENLNGYTYLRYKTKGGSVLLILQCEVCSKDVELFPEGTILYNIHTKTITCPCYSKYFRKTPEQFRVLVERRCKEKGYELKSKQPLECSGSRIKLFNPETNNTWDCTVDNFLNGKRNDPVQANIDTADRCRLDTSYAENVVMLKLEDLGGNFLGWENGYTNNTSRFNWKCKNGHLVNSKYSGFLNNKVGCKVCVRSETSLYGFFPDRLGDTDNLYVFCIDNLYLKVGRTFDLESRLRGIKYQANTDGIELVKTISGTHAQIYKLEQNILNTIKDSGMVYESAWTTESCNLEGLEIIMQHIKIFEKEGEKDGQ